MTGGPPPRRLPGQVPAPMADQVPDEVPGPRPGQVPEPAPGPRAGQVPEPVSGPLAGKYELLGVIGRGGMATVFLGRARGAGGFSRLVAVKRAHPHVAGDAALTASMKHEAGLASRLHHPNVVRVIDVVEEAQDLLLVLDYVEGGTLADLTKRGSGDGLGGVDARTRARIVVRIALDVAAGLDAAHRALDDAGRGLGIVHRDVSPSNVLVGTDGVARLTDFGIAKALEAGPELTATGELKGKIAYMAPEYVEQHRADPATDQFSLAVVAWEALAGRRLFRGPTDVQTLKNVVSCRVPSLAAIEPVTAPVEAVITRALARAASERFGSVRELAEALESAARSADLVASHREVGDLVETALRAPLAARRRLVRGLVVEGAPEAVAAPLTMDPAAPLGRDDVGTASIAIRPPPAPPIRNVGAPFDPAIDAGIRNVGARSGGNDDVGTAPIAGLEPAAPRDFTGPPARNVGALVEPTGDGGTRSRNVGTRSPRTVLAVAAAVASLVVATASVLLLRGPSVVNQAAAEAGAARDPLEAPGSAVLAASATAMEPAPAEASEPAPPGASAPPSSGPKHHPRTPPAGAHPVSGSGAARRPASSGAVPRKAPPNPYVH